MTWDGYKQKPSFKIKDNLSVQNAIIFREQRAVVPASLHWGVMHNRHAWYLSFGSWLKRARECIHWPGMNSQLWSLIERCNICQSCENITDNNKESMGKVGITILLSGRCSIWLQWYITPVLWMLMLCCCWAGPKEQGSHWETENCQYMVSVTSDGVQRN